MAHTTVSFASPITLDTLDDLFAHHRARFGGWVMEDGAGDSGGGDSGDGGDAGNSGGAGDGGDQGGSTDTDGQQQTGKVTFDETQQAYVDRLIAEKLGKEKQRYEQQLKDLRDSAGKTEVEKLTAERDRYKEQAEGAPKTYGPRLAKTEAKLAAKVAGARDDRLAAIVAQAKLDDAVGDDGEVDDAKVQAAVEQVLKDFPEWKGTATRSGGDMDGDGGKAKSFTEAQIAAMSPAEYDKNRDDILAAVAAGRVSKG